MCSESNARSSITKNIDLHHLGKHRRTAVVIARTSWCTLDCEETDKVRAFAQRLWNAAAQLRFDAEQLMALALVLLPFQVAREVFEM